MKTEKDCFSITPAPGVGAAETQRPEINLLDTETDGKPDDQIICCGYVPVVLMKMFGPLIFADIRIRAESKTCEWIVERENIKTMEWVEVIRIPGQLESEFKDDDEPDAVVRPRVITLTEEVRQDVPLAYMVFCHKDIDHDYMLFPKEREAHDYAMEQEERADMPEGSWPMYALWATKWPGEKVSRRADNAHPAAERTR